MPPTLLLPKLPDRDKDGQHDSPPEKFSKAPLWQKEGHVLHQNYPGTVDTQQNTQTTYFNAGKGITPRKN